MTRAPPPAFPHVGRLSLPLFYVGLVGEAWKVGVGLLDMALLADHSGLTRFSFSRGLANCKVHILSLTLPGASLDPSTSASL